MTYDPTLESPKDKVRHLIGDIQDYEFLSDKEIELELELAGGDLYRAGAECCRAIAARVARNSDVRFSTLWQDSSQVYDHYTKLAVELERRAGRQSTVSPKFTGDNKKVFKQGQFDNYRGPNWDMR